MRLLHALRASTAGLALCAFALAPVCADQYPGRPITIVVPYTPGGSVDLLARALGPRITADWHQQIVVDNRPGAGGSVGAAFVAHAPPDGYTLLLSTNAPLTTNMALYPSIGYDAARDFTPIILAGENTSVIAVNPKVPAKTIRELITLAKKKPGALAASTSGNGSTSDLTVAEFDRAAGVQIRAVPYRGGVPSLAAAMSGEVPIVFSDLVPAMPYIRAGKLRALAVTSAAPAPMDPSIPTLAGSGLPGFDISSWVGLLAPAGTPPAIVHQLYVEVEKILRSPSFRSQLVANNLHVLDYDPQRFAAYLKSEIPRWKTRVEESKLQVQ